jgi:hypothetical protein
MHNIPAFLCGLKNHSIAVNLHLAAPVRVIHIL